MALLTNCNVQKSKMEEKIKRGKVNTLLNTYSRCNTKWKKMLIVKVSKSRKQNTNSKKPAKICRFFVLASKKWLKQKIKVLDDLN